MAKQAVNVSAQVARLTDEIRAGIFKPVYLLMGDEPYYPELVCQEIIDHCIEEDWAKDFNESICYGADVRAETIVTMAREFPMMTDRRLIVIKEAQLCKDLEKLSVYLEDPLDSTVLVILMHQALADKRRALYKNAGKVGVVLESPLVRDYELPAWIQNYYRSKGLSIDPQAAVLLAESTGASLSTIAVETDKLMKNLPEGADSVTVSDIEKNVGISRQFSVFELTKELSYRNSSKALKIAAHLGASAKFAMPMAVSALYTHFSRILKYSALLSSGKPVTPDAKAAALPGVSPFFYKEYDLAVRNYPLQSLMSIMSMLCEYDYLGKGGDGGAMDDGELITELVLKILNT